MLRKLLLLLDCMNVFLSWRRHNPHVMCNFSVVMWDLFLGGRSEYSLAEDEDAAPPPVPAKTNDSFLDDGHNHSPIHGLRLLC